jgi:hypothetical protein
MNMADIPTKRVYDGWTCDHDESRPPKRRWRATKNTRFGTYELFSSSESGLRIKIEAKNEEMMEGAHA